MKDKNVIIGSVIVIGVVSFLALRKSPRKLVDSIMKNSKRNDSDFEKKLLMLNPKTLRMLEKPCRENPELCSQTLSTLFK